MMLFSVEIHLNATYCTASDVPEPLLRTGSERVRPGDTFVYICTLELEADTARGAFAMAYAASNSDGGDGIPGSDQYDWYAAGRPMQVGDAVLVHTPDGALIAYADPDRWVDIPDIDPYTLYPGEPRTTATTATGRPGRGH